MDRSPLSSGVLLAFVSALAFGSTTPFIHRFGTGVGIFTTASALYIGAAIVAVLWRTSEHAEAPVQREHLFRILLVALAGAVIAPTALAWGLRHADATSASLLLNFEAILTVLFASIFLREAIGARVWMAAALMLVGGTVLVVASGHASRDSAWGLGAVLLATIAWAADNTFTQPLSNLDPMGVIARKAALGAAFTALLALAFREPLPPWTNLAWLLVCGATGYGLSLRVYLLAQRRIGAARTGSVFAAAPFVGATLAWIVGEGHAGWPALVASVFFGVAVLLHLSEKHRHTHHHHFVRHEHAHRHDDGHHSHVHDPPVEGSHSHEHAHAEMIHEHEHAPDLHHEHQH